MQINIMRNCLNFLSRPLVAAVFFLAATGVLADGMPRLDEFGARMLKEPVELPEFTLIDHKERLFERDALKGKWSILFLGYTSCPDICPTTLASLNVIVKKLGSSGVDTGKIQVVMVSVDPLRDVPAKLAEQVAFFNPEFIGVTGLQEEIDKFVSPMGGRYDYENLQTGEVFHDLDRLMSTEGYGVLHNSDLFILDPQARLVAWVFPPHGVQRVTDLLKQIFNYYED